MGRTVGLTKEARDAVESAREGRSVKAVASDLILLAKSAMNAASPAQSERVSEPPSSKGGAVAECIECQKKEQELKTRAGKIESLETKLKQLQGEYPSMVDMVRHCESGECSSHKREWDEIKAAIAKEVKSDISMDDAKEIAHRHGLWPPPDIILPGLSPRAKR